jgi:hypothetical protein
MYFRILVTDKSDNFIYYTLFKCEEHELKSKINTQLKSFVKLQKGNIRIRSHKTFKDALTCFLNDTKSEKVVINTADYSENDSDSDSESDSKSDSDSDSDFSL